MLRFGAATLALSSALAVMGMPTPYYGRLGNRSAAQLSRSIEVNAVNTYNSTNALYVRTLPGADGSDEEGGSPVPAAGGTGSAAESTNPPSQASTPHTGTEPIRPGGSSGRNTPGNSPTRSYTFSGQGTKPDPMEGPSTHRTGGSPPTRANTFTEGQKTDLDSFTINVVNEENLYFYVSAKLGNEGKEFRLLPDTGASGSWVYSTEFISKLEQSEKRESSAELPAHLQHEMEAFPELQEKSRVHTTLNCKATEQTQYGSIAYKQLFVGNREVSGIGVVRQLAIGNIAVKDQMIGCATKVDKDFIVDTYDGILGLGPTSLDPKKTAFHFDTQVHKTLPVYENTKLPVTANWFENARATQQITSPGTFTIDYRKIHTGPNPGNLKLMKSTITFGHCLCPDKEEYPWIDVDTSSAGYEIKPPHVPYAIDSGASDSTVPADVVDQYWKGVKQNALYKTFVHGKRLDPESEVDFDKNEGKWFFLCELADAVMWREKYALPIFKLELAGSEIQIPASFLKGLQKSGSEANRHCWSTIQPNNQGEPYILGVQFYLNYKVCHDYESSRIKYCPKFAF